MNYRTWAEIDSNALRHNAAACRAAVPAGCAIHFAIVKANAYGHGVALVAHALRDQVDGFGVANLAEARELAALPGCDSDEKRVLILSPALPNECEGLVAGGFEASVSTVGEAAAFAALGEKLGVPAKVHVIADTGMGRIGAPGDEAFSQLVAWIQSREKAGGGIRLAGIATHFPSADEEVEFTRAQAMRFRETLERLGLPGSSGLAVHVANSAGLFGYRDELSFVNAARPGLALYGASPLPEFQEELRPVLRWIARVTLVRDLAAGATVSYGRTFTAPRPMRVATLAVGYADGYPRSLSNRGAEVLIAGRRRPVLGRVTMDQIMIDVTDSPVAAGDEAVLIGRQADETITAAELAEKAGTIPWEIFTGIGSRVARVAV
jgi:alanine racemase